MSQRADSGEANTSETGGTGAKDHQTTSMQLVLKNTPQQRDGQAPRPGMQHDNDTLPAPLFAGAWGCAGESLAAATFGNGIHIA